MTPPDRAQSRMDVWVTRAQPGADATANRLAALGFHPVVAPVLEVRVLETPQLDLTRLDALAFTSANAVRTFAALTPERDLRALCVGAASAAAAEAGGFSRVRSADGDVHALAELIAATLPPGATVGHPRAVEAAGDLAGLLSARGVSCRPMPIYETLAVDSLPQPVTEMIERAEAAAVLIHSPKAAKAVARLLAALPASACGRLHALAISEAALAPLGGLLEGTIAATPDEAALLDLLPS